MPGKSRFGRNPPPDASHICPVFTVVQLEIKALKGWMALFFN